MYIDPSKPDRTTMLTEATTNQLMNARHLYYMAKQNLESKQTIRLFAGTNLLQDAVEALLWAAASHKGISRDRSEVMQLYDDVNAALSPEHLSFRPAVVQLNKIRINSKHYGICPDQKETGRLLTSMAEFLRETTRTAFSVNFWTISLLDLLKKDEIKTALTDAQAAFDRGEYLICLIGCRKAIYLLFEFWYNVEKFRYNSQTAFGLGAFSRAPLFARNPEWIANYVNDLFEYIHTYR